MSSQLTIDLDLAGGLDETLKAELTAKAKTTVVLGLFEAGKISSGAGARMLGITRRDFLDLLFEHKISPVSYAEGELEEELRQAKQFGQELRRRPELGQ
jgi:predicted HTH domain antitoxin